MYIVCDSKHKSDYSLERGLSGYSLDRNYYFYLWDYQTGVIIKVGSDGLKEQILAQNVLNCLYNEKTNRVRITGFDFVPLRESMYISKLRYMLAKNNAPYVYYDGFIYRLPKTNLKSEFKYCTKVVYTMHSREQNKGMQFLEFTFEDDENNVYPIWDALDLFEFKKPCPEEKAYACAKADALFNVK